MLVTSVINAWMAALAPILALLAGGGIFAAIKANHGCVKEGELGVKLLLGRLLRHRFGPKKGQIKTYRPGRGGLTIFLVLKLVREKVQPAAHELETDTFTLSDWTVFTCGGTVQVSIPEELLEGALFGTADLVTVVKQRAIAVRQAVLAGKHAKDLVGESYKRLTDELKRSLHEEVKAWVCVERFDLTGLSYGDPLTAARLQIDSLTKEEVAAVNRAATELGIPLSDIPILAAALLPNSSALVAGVQARKDSLGARSRQAEELQSFTSPTGQRNGKPPG